MGHRIQSTEPLFKNPQDSGFILFGEAKHCNKRFVCDEDSFDAPIKKPKQEDQNEIFSVRGETLDEDETLIEEYIDSTPSHSEDFENAPQRFAFYEYPPRKTIPIGPDHQAEIPNYSPQNSINNNDSNKWIQNSVLQPQNNIIRVENDLLCDCDEIRSIDCVRKHVKEVREALKLKLGFKKFLELGFGDMGEEVASQWSEEEERLFSQVVRFNPASFGKNFWTVLPLAFPNKCTRDFVSYYFNVFILRKRAGQNRSDPLYIDSEDDEWYDQEIHQDRYRLVQEEEDEADLSGVESSPINNYNSELGLGFEETEMEEDERKEEDENENGSENCLKGKGGDEMERGGELGLGLGLEMQDESCTSFEAHMEWEIEFEHNNSSKRKDELLPTCNVIEEVFGEGDFI